MKPKLTLISLIIFAFMSFYSCASANNIEIQQDPIIGKWGLVKTVRTGRPAPATIIHSPVEVVFEFKPNGILTIHCLRQDNEYRMWRAGNYSYSTRFSATGELMIDIHHNNHWWLSVSEKELILCGAPVDRLSYFFERININE